KLAVFHFLGWGRGALLQWPALQGKPLHPTPEHTQAAVPFPAFTLGQQRPKGPFHPQPGLTTAQAHTWPWVGDRDEGELCLNSAQCTSKCCHREDGLSLARCAPKASENSECSAFTLYGIYYKCPCERGLTCNVDKTIVGSITNTNFGVCLDLGRATE
uniref:Colipase n=1 Tax=Bos taurus TaxID=9913 RepID=A0AAA9SUL7_BOVIN